MTDTHVTGWASDDEWPISESREEFSRDEERFMRLPGKNEESLILRSSHATNGPLRSTRESKVLLVLWRVSMLSRVRRNWPSVRFDVSAR
jgi:hypothetical protein